MPDSIPERPSILDRFKTRLPPSRTAILQRLDEQDARLRGLRRRVRRLEEEVTARDEVVAQRSFQLKTPSLDPEHSRTLEIEVPSRFYVPEILEQQGLAGYEAPTLACWLTILSMPDVGAAFDVGANVGPFAWLAAAYTDRMVVAFEPVPELLEAVDAVARRNDLEIRNESIALSDTDGSATFYLSDQTDSSNSLVEGFRRSSRSIDVVVRTLDTYVEETGSVPFALKIDTETNEPEVLRGAHHMLSRNRPWMIVEVLANRTEDRLMEVLRPYGYSWYRIDDVIPLTPAVEIVGDPTYEHSNWLFAPTPPSDAFWSEMERWRIALRACGPDNC